MEKALGKVLHQPLGNTVYIMPPYCITEAQLSKVYRTIVEILMRPILAYYFSILFSVDPVLFPGPVLLACLRKFHKIYSRAASLFFQQSTIQPRPFLHAIM